MVGPWEDVSGKGGYFRKQRMPQTWIKCRTQTKVEGQIWEKRRYNQQPNKIQRWWYNLWYRKGRQGTIHRDFFKTVNYSP